MILYPGIAPLTVATSGAAPGIIVTAGSGDAHGWWPGPLVAQGGDPRSAANLMTAVEAVTDRVNWIGWRAVDYIFGGDYSAWTAAVKLGTALALVGAPGAGITFQVVGRDSASLAAEITAGTGSNGTALLSIGDGTGAGVDGRGGATAPGVKGKGGATSGAGGDFRATTLGEGAIVVAVGAKPGLDVTAGTNQPGVKCNATGGGGYVQVLGNISTSSADPDRNALWGTSIEKAGANLTVTGNGSSASVVVNDGLNIATGGSAPFVNQALGKFWVEVTFTRAFANANYWPTGNMVDASNHNVSLLVGSSSVLKIYLDGGTVNFLNVGTWQISFRAGGNQ